MRHITEIKRIYIHQKLEKSAIVQNVLKRAPFETEIEYIENPKTILSHFQERGELHSRTDLLITSHQGRFFSTCPGTDGMVCCQYFVIHLGQGCLFDCHYCYLQGFLNNPLLTLFGNLEDLFAQLDQHTLHKKFHFRIGTGEYTDSLALEPLTGLASHLIAYFANHPNATLELKTKSSHVDDLLDLDHRGHTVIAWSINPESIINIAEEGTASLEERLSAAKQAQGAGYRIAFHLDPLIYFENWEEEYHALIDQIFTVIDPDKVAWLSSGSFRYTPRLKEMIQSRFPDDTLTRMGEMIQGSDGKHRYFKTIRQEMFSSIKRKIESIDPKLFLYLCMESKKMWSDVFGFVPNSGKRLDALFEERRHYLNELTLS